MYRLSFLALALSISASHFSFAAPKDLHGKDLSRKEFKDENLDRADLSGANLQWADLTHATIKNANLKGADLQGARLTSADLTGADLRGAALRQARLEDATFTKANLQGDDVYLAHGVKVDEENARKRQRLLEDANASLAILDERNGMITFKEADLRRANLHGSLDGVDFRRADLRGANLGDTTDSDKAKWKGAMYDSGTRWPGGFDSAAAGTVAGSEEGAAAPKSGAFDPVGHWMIKAEANGAREEGLLTIAPDGSYKWDYSVKAEPVTGTWKQADGGPGPGAILLLQGEGNASWTMSAETSHTDRPDSAELTEANGSGKRWAVPVAAP